MRKAKSFAAALGVVCMGATGAAAQSAADYYAGKTIQLRVGYAPGGGYDLAGRTASRYWGKFIPGNPQIVVQNMPGGASLVLTKWLLDAAPKDGSVIGLVSRGIAFEPLLKAPQSDYDAMALNWIGNVERASSFCAAWADAGIKSLDDIVGPNAKTLIIGGTGPTSDDELFARVVREMFSANVKIVTGYAGSTPVHLAMERGEVHGRCNLSAADLLRRPHWKDKVNVFLTNGMRHHPAFKDVPLALDVAKTDEQKAVLRLFYARQEMAYPFVAPPGVPADRVKALRDSFMKMAEDKEFRSEAEKQFIEVSPVSGEEITKIIKDAYASDPKVIERASKLRNQ
ncbi:MAG: tripartite tricarboxylate transporter substrate-binding protein [Beijerinckiaceae bacterium]|nr:tripartite tricarboxylate transporter substrate-binding protein [Beijerinckiaceae bacterium]